jgi:hypothetical protein
MTTRSMASREIMIVRNVEQKLSPMGQLMLFVPMVMRVWSQVSLSNTSVLPAGRNVVGVRQVADRLS